MKENKYTKKFWIMLGIGIAATLFGLLLMLADFLLGLALLFAGIIFLVCRLLWGKESLFTIAMLLSYVFVTVLLATMMGGGLVNLLIAAGLSLIIVLPAMGLFKFISDGVKESICPECGKKFALKEVSRELIDSYETTMDVKQEIKDSQGKVTGSYTQTVPATKYIYECVVRCKYCKHEDVVKKSDVRRD